MTQPETKQLVIPATHKGHLIGRGGQQISFIRRESHADIKLVDNGKNMDAVVTIKGRIEDVECAETMIEMTLAQFTQAKTTQPMSTTVHIPPHNNMQNASSSVHNTWDMNRQIQSNTGVLM